MATTSINDLPDELLLHMLTFLPYSKVQHNTLRNVNRRFYNLLKPPVLPLRVAQRQYSEQVALLGLQDIRSNTLEQLYQWKQRVKETTSAMQIKSLGGLRAFETGIFIFDIIAHECMMAGTSDEWKRLHALVIEHTIEGCLSKKACMTLRYTIIKVTESLDLTPSDNESYTILVPSEDRPSLSNAAVMEVLRCRALEIVALPWYGNQNKLFWRSKLPHSPRSEKSTYRNIFPIACVRAHGFESFY